MSGTETGSAIKLASFFFFRPVPLPFGALKYIYSKKEEILGKMFKLLTHSIAAAPNPSPFVARNISLPRSTGPIT